jgi:ADP-ribose pyrophosphatase
MLHSAQRILLEAFATTTWSVVGYRPMMDTLGTREVYRNEWMSVREDRVRHSDGSSGVFGVVDKPDFAVVIARDERGLWMVEQYRYPVRRRAWEFPQGSWGVGKSGSSAELADAELREETGLQAEQFRRLGYLHEAYGFCSQGFDVYLATGLHPGPPARERTEGDMQHQQITERDLRTLIARGDVVDAPTVAAYGLLLLDEQPAP